MQPGGRFSGRGSQAAVRRAHTLIITRRLSALVDTDQILVLEDCRVIEQGRRHQLLARGGHCARMWARQQATPTNGFVVNF